MEFQLPFTESEGSFPPQKLKLQSAVVESERDVEDGDMPESIEVQKLQFRLPLVKQKDEGGASPLQRQVQSQQPHSKRKHDLKDSKNDNPSKMHKTEPSSPSMKHELSADKKGHAPPSHHNRRRSITRHAPQRLTKSASTAYTQTTTGSTAGNRAHTATASPTPRH